VRTGQGRAAVPATCGELVQGSLDGTPCLVSCPINVYSVAEVELSTQDGWQVPVGLPKAVAGLYAGLQALRPSAPGGCLRLHSELPRGRGYGSSTADLGATLYALGQACGQPLEPHQVARLAVTIEPSDSSLFPGLALFDHRRGSFCEVLGMAPPLCVITIDPGGEVDTLAFNELDHQTQLRRLAGEHRQAFELLRHALRSNDWRSLGEAATLSARVHQVILHNPWLEQVLGLARAVDALGICRAHSGTLLGVLLDGAHADARAVADYLRRRLPPQLKLYVHQLVDGGPYYPDACTRPPPMGVGLKYN